MKKNVSSTAFKIEKGIELQSDGPRIEWPFGAMAIGDSFALPANLYLKVSSAASYWGSRHNSKFSIRKNGDGYRVWRIA